MKLAAAITARSLFGADDRRWGERSLRYRAVWGGVLAVGVGFGLSGARPIPAILLAQVLNGILLPLVGAFLLLAVNDRSLMGRRINGPIGNIVLTAVVGVALLLSVLTASETSAASLLSENKVFNGYKIHKCLF